MSRVSCIEHPAREPFVTLRSSYMELTGADACAAMLLSALEHWTNSRLNNEEERGGDLWIFRTIDQLRRDDLLGCYGRDRVSRALNELIDTGLIRRRRNPDKGWDRTWQYRLDLELLQDAIDTCESGLNRQTRLSANASSETAVSNRPGDGGEEGGIGGAAQGRESDLGPETQSRKSDDASSAIRASKVGNPTSNTTDSVTNSDRDVSDETSLSNDVDLVRRVFDAWVESTGRDKVRTKLNADRRRLIQRRLADYPVEDLLAAVRGWRHSKHHRGENDTGTVYNDLGLLLRDSSRVEFFRDLDNRNGHGGRRHAGPRRPIDPVLEGRAKARIE